MQHIDFVTARGASVLGAISMPAPPARSTTSRMTCPGSAHHALVHVVDIDADAQQLLTRWFNAVGIETQTYAHLGAFLNADRVDLPGCLVIDAQPPAISGLEPQAILLHLAIRCPIVMTCRPNLEINIGAMKTGAVAFVEKPLREQQVLATVRAAIDVDRRQRLIVSRCDELRARFATLSQREREVMALVTVGKLNKQVGSELGVSEITVKAHRGAAMRKMGARSLPELVRMADAIGMDAGPIRSPRSTPAQSVVGVDRRSGYSPRP